MSISFRRKAVKLVVRGLLSATLALPIFPALANEQVVAQQPIQVAGFYRMMLGDYEVTALYDGYLDIGKNVLQGINAKQADKFFERMFINSSNGVQTAVNAFLINTKDHLILIDAGAANCFGDTLGNISNNIKAAGYSVDQIDTILMTHLHPDHVCGVSNEGKMVFPHATLYVAKTEADFWLNSDLAVKVPVAKKHVKSAEAAVAPYQAANQFKTFTVKSPLAEIELVPTAGHTAGHTSYLITSQGQSLLVWGDIVHSYSIQFTKPEVSLTFDSDSQQAIATRKQLFSYVASNKLWVAAAHLPFPGLGHVRAEGNGYVWVPIEYSPIIKK